MFVARPLSVFLCLAPFRMARREKAYVSWVGLRGSVPIVLATFPASWGLPEAAVIFHLVFFIVLLSMLLQGLTLVASARWLGLAVGADKGQGGASADGAAAGAGGTGRGVQGPIAA